MRYACAKAGRHGQRAQCEPGSPSGETQAAVAESGELDDPAHLYLLHIDRDK